MCDNDQFWSPCIISDLNWRPPAYIHRRENTKRWWRLAVPLFGKALYGCHYCYRCAVSLEHYRKDGKPQICEPHISDHRCWIRGSGCGILLCWRFGWGEERRTGIVWFRPLNIQCIVNLYICFCLPYESFARITRLATFFYSIPSCFTF